MSIVVVGSSGQLAYHLRELLPHARFLSRADADLANPTALENALLAAQPTCIVNAAAYTAVDRAESETGLAWAVNADAPALIARIATKLNAAFVHVSTDYVFGGQGQRAWLASDPVAPINVYGRSKLAGELAVATLCRQHWILRTSWVFSEHGANFVKTMLRLAAEKPELRVVDDQRGRPTYARDLAQLIAALCSAARPDEVLPFGLHHATGGPAVSWREFAERIIEVGYRRGMLARRVPVIGIRTDEYPTPARRPANSVLEPAAFPAGIAFDWQAGLERVMSRLQQTSA
jgi:dTDP-4-dehydrorhamnose reductase